MINPSHTASAEQINRSIEQVIMTIESVAAATEQAAANSSEITDMITKTVGAVNQVNKIIQDHTGLSQNLNQIIKQFNI